MKLLRNLLNRTGRSTGARFDRYYGEIVRSGVGYPTADEARRDRREHDRSVGRYGWLRYPRPQRPARDAPGLDRGASFRPRGAAPAEGT